MYISLRDSKTHNDIANSQSGNRKTTIKKILSYSLKGSNTIVIIGSEVNGV